MAYQPVDIGAAPNDGTGDPIRDAFDKCNDNFVELYAGLTGLLDFKGSTDCSANPNYPAASKGDFYVVSVAGKIGGASGVDVEVGDAYFAEVDNAGGTQAAVGTSWSIIQGNTTGAGAGIDVEDEGVSETIGATTLNFTGAGVTAADAGGGVVDITIPGGGGTFDLGDADDVDTTGQTTGDVLTYDGAEWVPQAPSGGSLTTPTIRASNISSSSNSSFVLTFPTGTIAGDVVIVFGNHGNSISKPAGWFELDISTGTNTNGACFAKEMTAGDITTGSVTVTASGSFNGVFALVTIDGATMQSLAPPHKFVRSSSGATSVPLEIVIAEPSDLVIAYIGTRAAVNATFSAGITSLQAVNATNASGAVGEFTGTPGKVGIDEDGAFSASGTGYYTAMVVARGL